MKNSRYFFILMLFVLSFSIVPFTTAAEDVQTTTVNEKLQEDKSVKMKDATLEGEIKSAKKSEYVLPYPGILPDHPLYAIKKFRDQIIDMLVVDPMRKADFYLLQSDKFLAASMTLEGKNKKELSQNMLDLSSEKITQSVDFLKKAKADNRQIVSGTLDRMQNAVEKHLEIVDDLTAKQTVDTKGAREALLKAGEEIGALR